MELEAKMREEKVAYFSLKNNGYFRYLKLFSKKKMNLKIKKIMGINFKIKAYT